MTSIEEQARAEAEKRRYLFTTPGEDENLRSEFVAGAVWAETRTRALHEQVSKVLREYGQAIRGDWSEIDGRSVRNDMEEIARWVEDPSLLGALQYGGNEGLRAARYTVGICPEGGGHWDHYCEDDWTECKETP
jgi:DNA-binding protein Fis